VLATVLAGSQVSCGKRQPPTETPPPAAAQPALGDDIEQLLTKKAQLVAGLVGDPVIVEAVRESNRLNQGLSMQRIQELDKKWMAAAGEDQWVGSFMTNPAAKRLSEFQKSHAGFAEVFVADAKGLNVCQTNKTSDYYQADEDWWVVAFNDGKGKTHRSRIEYDESSRTRAISIYVPVMDPERAVAIGVCKAVVDLDALGQEL
jgi:hypothetical protein